MCGIAGKLSFKPDEVSWPDLADSWLRLMARRGPDEEGRWTDGSHCGFAFRRLSILDLSPTGNQPMTTDDGRYVIVYNGELYNFHELRRELEQEGVHFQSSGDTEVVLYSLAYWGIAALNKFNGMFALGFYDTKEKRLLLARDHVGIKPLYYMQTPQGLVFASQYDQILAHPWSQTLSVDTNAMALY
jgi:asparagine synthase (glutamine-hydrolysing)